MYCSMPVPADTEEEYRAHLKRCNERPLTAEDVADIRQKVHEIHEFCANIADALKGLEKNPMIRTMLGL